MGIMGRTNLSPSSIQLINNFSRDSFLVYRNLSVSIFPQVLSELFPRLQGLLRRRSSRRTRCRQLHQKTSTSFSAITTMRTPTRNLRVVVVVVEDSTAMKELSVTAMLAAPITEQSQLRTADKIDQLVLKELTMDVDVEDPAAVATWTVTAEP